MACTKKRQYLDEPSDDEPKATQYHKKHKKRDDRWHKETTIKEKTNAEKAAHAKYMRESRKKRKEQAASGEKPYTERELKAQKVMKAYDRTRKKSDREAV